MKRGFPGGAEVRKSVNVGPNYPERLYRNPFDGGVDHETGDETTKTINSPSNTITGVDLPLNRGYDSLWEGK